MSARRFAMKRVTRCIRTLALAGLGLAPAELAPAVPAVSAVVSVLFLAEYATASTIFVSSAGSDSNAGTDPALPRLTLPTSVGNGDSIFVSGVVRGTTTYTSKSGLTVGQWIGQAQGIISGGTPVAAAAWVLVGGNTYKAAVGAMSPGIVGVAVVGVAATPTPAGTLPAFFPYSFANGMLTAVGSLTGGQVATTNGWFYDGSNFLYVNLNGDNPSAVPNTFSLEYMNTSGLNLLQFTACTSPTVNGLYFTFNTHTVGAQGYGVYMQTSSNPTIRNVTGIDLGPHHFGFLVCTGTQTLSGWYGEGGTEQCAYAVFYNSTGDVSGGRVSGGYVRFRRWLKRDGTEFAVVSLSNQGMGLWHTDGGATGFVLDVQWDDCWAEMVSGYHSGGEPYWLNGGGTAVDAAGTAFSPSNRKTWTAFPVRVTGGGCIGNWQQVNFTGTIGVRRAVAKVDRGWTSDQSFGRGCVSLSGNQGVYTCVLLEGCVVIGNTDSSSTAHVEQIFLVTNENSGNSQIVRVNCSVYDKGVQVATGFRSFDDYYSQDAAIYEAYGCVFEHATLGDHTAMCVHDAGTSVAHHVYVDCVYKNVYTDNFINDRWSQNTDIDTPAEWFASVDTNGLYKTGTLFPYAAAASLALDPTSQLWALRRATSSVVPTAGINGPYASFFGAYQYQNPPVQTAPGMPSNSGRCTRAGRRRAA